MIYTDKEIACGLCDKDKEISEAFYKHYESYLFKIAGINLHNVKNVAEGEELFKAPRMEKITDGLYETTIGAPLLQGKQYTIRISDNVMLAYTWLLERIRNEGCKYCKKDNPHNTFERTFHLKTCTNNFKTDWIRKMKGSVQYVPKYIREKGSSYVDVTRLRLQYKNKDEICHELKMDELDYNIITQDEGVKRYLRKRDRLDGAKRKTGKYYESEEKSLIQRNDEGKETSEYDSKMMSDETYSPEANFSSEDIQYQSSKIIKKIFTKEELALLKVSIEDNRIEPDKLLSFIKEDRLMRAKRMGIETVDKFDVFEKKCEKKFINHLVEWLTSNKYPEISIERAREYFHEYFIEFYSS